MSSLLLSRRDEPRRWLLAVVLGLIAVFLLAEGGYLAAIGGSFYYVIAGAFLAACAYFAAGGDGRGRWLYGAFLIGTGLWALWERGFDPWALQARLFAPLVLALWVFLPVLRRYRFAASGIAILAAVALVWLCLGGADPVQKPSAPVPPLESGSGDWLHFGNDLRGSRYSPLALITPDNVGRLKEVWRIRTGAKLPGSALEASPLMVGGTLYLCTPSSVIIALDPETGARRWTFDPKARVPIPAVCRGVAYYAVPNKTGPCAERIIFATVDARLMAVDAKDGALCRDFGEGGTVDQTRGLGPVKPGYYRTSSAPEVVRGKVILGAAVADGQYVGEPSGVIRAYDAETGKLVWAWDMGHPDRHGTPPEGESYTLGTPNSWAPISADEEFGLVYLPTGNSTPDYWGAHRAAVSEKYSSSVVALDVETGALRWSFQTVHHDVWDYDVASQPTLVDLPIQGQTVPALIMPTKQGQVFLLDRRTGAPLAKVEEKPVAGDAAPGDFAAPTQPFSTGMPAFDNTRLSERSMWGMTPLDQLWCRIQFREARYEGPFTPMGVRPTISYPGYVGGIDWGGVSVDPEHHLMVVNWNRMANVTRLIPRAKADAMGLRPSETGRIDHTQPVAQAGTPFAALPLPFMSPMLLPCTEPPFGKIAVVDLDQRKILWERPLGDARDSGPFGMRSHLSLPIGVPSTGGSVTTKSGVIFIAATLDLSIRAFDLRDGRKLWSARLPAPGNATPVTFVSPQSGRQFLVISAGGNALGVSPTDDYVVAYTLP